MRKVIFLCLTLFFVNSLNAAKIASLPGILKPEEINVDENRVYISNQNGVSVFSPGKLKLTGKIGKRGEGPGEFLFTPHVQILTGTLFLYTSRKFSFFNKAGELQEEKSLSFPVLNANSIGSNYITNQWTYVDNRAFSEIILYDRDLKKIKSLHKSKKEVNIKKIFEKIPFVSHVLKFQCWGNKIYFMDSKKGFVIEVYDASGNHLSTIRREYEKIKITSSDKKRIIEEFKNKPFVKNRWSFLKKYADKFESMFPEYFPAVDDFIVTDDKIYVKTYKSQNKKDEYIILGLNGDIEKRVFLPWVGNRLYSIKNGRFYYLRENEEAELWELHSMDIK
ncbi:MAG: hypothetical protein KAW12_20150 [Candidatus Aminicenantes bacterium]|nr:hypothetical protein [Candidatus Aminicenantes bacterium]